MIANLKQPFLTPEEYLVWEAEQELRHEYIEGEVYAIAGGTLPHNDIAVNFIGLLKPFLRDKGCKVRMSDVKVQDRNSNKYFYPDVVVSCNESDRRSRDLISFPKLIIEVLSPSTEAFDRGDKFKHYRRFPSLLEYVLVDAEKVGIDVYRRLDSGKWELTSYPEDFEGSDRADLFELTSIDFQCALAAIYEDVELSAVVESV